MESADMVLMRADIFSVVVAIDLSHAILRCIRRNLFWALAYNVTAIPIAAGLSLPLFHAILPPWVAGGAMAMSSVSVVLSSLSLLGYEPPYRQEMTAHMLLQERSFSEIRKINSMKASRNSIMSDAAHPGLQSLLSFADLGKEDNGEDLLEMEEGESTWLLSNGGSQRAHSKKNYGTNVI
jgi:hypothetical protein